MSSDESETQLTDDVKPSLAFNGNQNHQNFDCSHSEDNETNEDVEPQDIKPFIDFGCEPPDYDRSDESAAEESADNDSDYTPVKNSRRRVRFDAEVHEIKPSIDDFIDANDESEDMTELKPKKRPKRVPNRQWICDHPGCGKSFKKGYTLKMHKQLHSGVKYRCQWKDCLKEYNSEQSLQRHMNVHNNRFACSADGCQFRATELSVLRNHVLSHSDRNCFRCELNECRKEFKTAKKLRDHRLRMHPLECDEPWLHCPRSECQFRTKERHHLGCHIKDHDKSRSCPHCHKTDMTFSAMKKHLATVHRGKDYHKATVQCEWPGCEKMFANRSKMTDHMDSHTGKESFCCVWPGCDRKFTSHGKLGAHLRHHKNSQRLVCDYPNCGYKTVNSSQFSRHKASH